MSVKNKVVVITGAASGLGLGMANEFAKQGAKVVIADLDLQKTQIVANELANNFNVATLAVEMDVTKENQVNTAIDKVVETFGRLIQLLIMQVFKSSLRLLISKFRHGRKSLIST
jgi:3-hydroxybutyrate dehydrogenase